MSALRENTSSNDVKNLEVADNTGASKTVSFASIVFLEIDFELADLAVHDVTPVPVTSGTPMENKKKPELA